MKNARRMLAGLTIGLAVLAPPLLVAGASASSLTGTVTFVGTLTADATIANVRVRISGGECDGQKVNEQWVHINSGVLYGSTHESYSTNMRNAYSTLLAAFLTGKSIQIDGLPSCSTTEPIPLELPNSNVGLF
jgi:hypothetical protein